MLLEICNLTCGYGKKPTDNSIIKNMSFELEEGKSMAILGANGSGKTTLLKCIGGILSYSGSIKMLSKEIRDLKRRDIAVMQATLSQLSPLYFSYTVEETVALGRYLYAEGLFGGLGKRDKEIVEDCLLQNGLESIRDRQISELSGGQLQRVFLARTLAQTTPVLILDEPTNHLDLKYQDELTGFLKKWREKSTTLPNGQTVKNTLIGVFHDINMALEIADELMFIKDGEIVAMGSKESTATDENFFAAYGMDVAAYMRKQAAFWA